MAITFFGVATTPADNSAQAGPTVAITPPASMVDGDLVYVSVRYRASSGTISVGTTGGQVWQQVGSQYNTTNIRAAVFWCRFNGTWSANPDFTVGSGTNNMDAQMLVFRPTSAAYTWSLESGPNSATYSAPSSPFTVNITGRTTTAASSVSIAAWHSIDDNSWGTLSGTGWSKTSLGAQYRNNSTNDNSSSFAYNIKTTAGATNDVSQQQSALGGDAGSTSLVTFAETLVSVSLTGQSSATGVGSLGISNAFTGIVGVESAAAVGDAAAIVPGGGTNATGSPSGVASTTAVGTLGLVLAQVAEPVGVGVGAAVGALAVSVLLVASGVVSTCGSGEIAAIGASPGVVPVGGVVSNTAAGSLAISTPVIGLEGVGATAAAGTATASGGGILHGAGQPSTTFATAQAGAIAVAITLSVSGVAGTTAADDLLSTSIVEDVDGGQGTLAANTVTPLITEPISGAASAGSAGSVATVATVIAGPIGAQSIATVGNLAGVTEAGAIGAPGGIEGAAQVGTLVILWTFTVPLSGVEATVQVGTADVEGGDSTPVEVFPSGVSSTVQVGALSTGEALAAMQSNQAEAIAGVISVTVADFEPGYLLGGVRVVPAIAGSVRVVPALNGEMLIRPEE